MIEEDIRDAAYRVDGDRIAWRKTGSEIVVLDLGASTYFGLNESAGILWPALLTGSNLRQTRSTHC